jgi:hypothetical protein
VAHSQLTHREDDAWTTAHPRTSTLDEQLSRTGADAAALVAALSEESGAWRPAPQAWSVAECLDHLATADRVYLAAMRPAATRARAAGRWRRGPATPGLIGGWFARSLEPPARPLLKVKAPRKIRPRPGPPLAAAYADYVTAHRDVVAFPARERRSRPGADPLPQPVRPRHPLQPPTGLQVTASHERRHLWQAWNVRRGAQANEPTAPDRLETQP